MIVSYTISGEQYWEMLANMPITPCNVSITTVVNMLTANKAVTELLDCCSFLFFSYSRSKNIAVYIKTKLNYWNHCAVNIAEKFSECEKNKKF